MTVTSASWPSVAVTVMRWPGSTFFWPEGWAAIVARDCSDGTTVWKSTLAAGVQALTARTAAPSAEHAARRVGTGTRTPGVAVGVITGYGTTRPGTRTEGPGTCTSPVSARLDGARDGSGCCYCAKSPR